MNKMFQCIDMNKNKSILSCAIFITLQLPNLYINVDNDKIKNFIVFFIINMYILYTYVIIIYLINTIFLYIIYNKYIVIGHK